MTIQSIRQIAKLKEQSRMCESACTDVNFLNSKKERSNEVDNLFNRWINR